MDDLDDSFDRLLLDSDEEEEDYSNDDPQPALIRIEDANDSDDSSDSDDDEVILESQYPSWRSTFEPKEPFTFSDENSGVQDDAIYGYTDAIQFWRLFFTDEMVQLILTETNRYGYVKYTQWKPMEKEELLNFFGICIQMGFEKRAKLADYWSTRSIFSPSFAAKLMSRNRFTQILNSLHFADNELVDRTNRLYKIQPILQEAVQRKSTQSAQFVRIFLFDLFPN